MERQAQKITIRARGVNSGFNIKPTGVVEMKITFDSTESVNALRLLQLVGNDLLVFAKGDTMPKAKLGRYGFYSLYFDRDGESKLTIRSDTEAANVEAMSQLYQEQELVDFAFVGALT